MVNIDEIARLITENRSKEIYYNPDKDYYFCCSNLELLRASGGYSLKGNRIVKGISSQMQDFLDNQDGYYALFDYEDRTIKEDAKKFISLNEKDFIGFDINKLTFISFKKFIKENNLYDKWIEYFATEISFETHHWCIDNNLLEEETTPDKYQILRKYVDKLKEKQYEKNITGEVLFEIWDDYDKFHFNILGNEGIAHGISFIPFGKGDSYFNLMLTCDQLHINNEIISSLSETINFYFDEVPEDNFADYFDMNNPFGKDNKVTSIHVAYGNQYHSYLTKSVANLSIKYFGKMFKFLDDFINSSNFKEAKNKHDIKVSKLTDKYFVDPVDPFEMESLPFDFDRDYLPELTDVEIVKDKYQIVVRRMPDYMYDGNDTRTIHFVYVLFAINVKTGNIEYVIPGEPNLFYPLISLGDSIVNFDNFKIGKEIIVNNAIDDIFVAMLFNNYIKKGKIKVIRTNEDLEIDEIFDTFQQKFHDLGPDLDA